PIVLTGQYVRLELQDGYSNWSTKNEQKGTLTAQYIDGFAPIRIKDNKVPEVILRPNKKSGFPRLFFGSCSPDSNPMMSIYKHKDNDDAVSLYLHFSPLMSRKERNLSSCSQLYFQGKIILAEDVQFTESSLASVGSILKREQLKFCFEQGRGRIFWAEKELTSGLSAYTSLRCSGIWHDSYHALWRVIQQKTNKIIVSGDWCHIPVSQEWQIEMANKTMLLWQVKMKVDEKLSAEIAQVNLMLSPQYRDWVMPGFNRGQFSDEYTEDYDILPFRFCYGKAKEISAAAKKLPGIIFSSETEDNNLRAIVENTDNLYQARLLQYQRVNKGSLLPGEYLYFKGAIRIEAKKQLPKI
ncbi:MAG: hypothetical protein V1662_01935, partial [Candidatus Omnitrophota bacterium]